MDEEKLPITFLKGFFLEDVINVQNSTKLDIVL